MGGTGCVHTRQTRSRLSACAHSHGETVAWTSRLRYPGRRWSAMRISRWKLVAAFLLMQTFGRVRIVLAGPDKQLVVLSAALNRSAETLTLKGQNFGSTAPAVYCESMPMTVISATDSQLVVLFPGSDAGRVRTWSPWPRATASRIAECSTCTHRPLATGAGQRRRRSARGLRVRPVRPDPRGPRAQRAPAGPKGDTGFSRSAGSGRTGRAVRRERVREQLRVDSPFNALPSATLPGPGRDVQRVAVCRSAAATTLMGSGQQLTVVASEPVGGEPAGWRVIVRNSTSSMLGNAQVVVYVDLCRDAVRQFPASSFRLPALIVGGHRASISARLPARYRAAGTWSRERAARSGPLGAGTGSEIPVYIMSVMKSAAADTARDRWQREVLEPALKKSPERSTPFTTISGRPIDRLYTADDLPELRLRARPERSGRVSLHPRHPSDRLPRQALDDAAVRRATGRRRKPTRATRRCSRLAGPASASRSTFRR